MATRLGRLDTQVLEEQAERLQESLATPARSARTAVVLGRLLGVGFVVCFATGMYSHFLQDPYPWMRFPTRPAGLYRFTQGLHVVTGIACIPLLLAKLWTVYPKLFAFPPFSSVRQLLERLSVAVLVASALLQVGMGLLNTYQWYPWAPWFAFRDVHHALAWVAIGSVALHVAVQLPTIARHWRRGAPDEGL
ncbi:hypothetical protein [Microlunatus flavus]|uniref:Cytochrome b561 n=1 Tax=Microlunatus flavus TaxID=1036181 RepID=A0A1H9GCC0_9ACTN|nr:hypothetical protein [Microlunatus flavus]SEQ47795.1 hypothetical protein SAMN05421756_103582 [Microlunatus flavus]